MWRQWQPIGDALLAELPEQTRKQIMSDKRAASMPASAAKGRPVARR